MTDPTRGMVRLARAGALTLSTVGLSVGAHVLAGGEAPGIVGLLVVTTPVLLVMLALTHRRLGLPLLAALFGLTQLGLHRAFDAMTMGSPGVAMPTGHHGAHLTVVAASTTDAVARSAGSSLMTVAHVAAAALTVLLLARGEAALWRLLAWVLPTLPRTTVVPARHRVPASSLPLVVVDPRLARVPPRRGPPRGVGLA